MSSMMEFHKKKEEKIFKWAGVGESPVAVLDTGPHVNPIHPLWHIDSILATLTICERAGKPCKIYVVDTIPASVEYRLHSLCF